MITQTMIEQLTQEEYCHFLSYGDPKRTDEVASIDVDQYLSDSLTTDGDESWISTLESTTYPGMTFGYLDAL